MRPRGPVIRLAAGAATAGVAYQAGKRRGEPAAPPAAPSPVPTDTTADLERLAEMHGSGALTDAEFAAAKARLLGT